jgi:hypothetical protein
VPSGREELKRYSAPTIKSGGKVITKKAVTLTA